MGATSAEAEERHAARTGREGDQYTFVALAASTRRSSLTGPASATPKYDGIHSRSARAGAWHARDFDRWIPPVQRLSATRLAACARRHQQDLQRNQPSGKRRRAPLFAGSGSSSKPRGREWHPLAYHTSYVERSNLTLRMSSKRFARLSNGFLRSSSPIVPPCRCTSPIIICAACMRRCAARQRWRSALRIGCGRLAICLMPRSLLSRSRQKPQRQIGASNSW